MPPGGTVLDAFAGTAASGLTIIHEMAAGSVTLKWIGAEIDEEMYISSKKRLIEKFNQWVSKRGSFLLYLIFLFTNFI